MPLLRLPDTLPTTIRKLKAFPDRVGSLENVHRGSLLGNEPGLSVVAVEAARVFRCFSIRMTTTVGISILVLLTTLELSF